MDGSHVVYRHDDITRQLRDDLTATQREKAVDALYWLSNSTLEECEGFQIRVDYQVGRYSISVWYEANNVWAVIVGLRMENGGRLLTHYRLPRSALE